MSCSESVEDAPVELTLRAPRTVLAIVMAQMAREIWKVLVPVVVQQRDCDCPMAW